MSTKPDKTAADYIAIAICPALIILLVGSLVMFLLQIGYSGSQIGRLRWTMFWFVLAMVLVSRIAIEQSPGAAFLYGIALAAATSIMLTQYIGFLWVIWILLAVIWWISNKIVWDCTLIDEDQDASGQGLLQVTRFHQLLRPNLSAPRAVPSPGLTPLAGPSSSPRLGTGLGSLAPRSTAQSHAKRAAIARKNTKEKARAEAQEVHSPGLWVLYFSIGAIPLFGLGELLLDRGDASGKRFCFVMLLGYMLAALALLLLTSFLGLRRYLRQRTVIMPPVLAGSWIITGASIITVILTATLLLPRPNTPYSVAHLVTKLTSPAAETNEDSSSGSKGHESSAAKPGSKGQSHEDPSENRDPASGVKSSASSRQSPAKRDFTTQDSAVSGRAPSAIRIERWIGYLVLAIVVGAVLIRFSPQLRTLLLTAVAALRMPGRLKKRTVSSRFTSIGNSKGSGAGNVVPLPDPFKSGAAQRMPLNELIQYSFHGLQRWSESRGFVLEESETPIEFAERLSTREPALAREILLTSSYFSHVTYGAQTPVGDCRPILETLWSVIGFQRRP